MKILFNIQQANKKQSDDVRGRPLGAACFPVTVRYHPRPSGADESGRTATYTDESRYRRNVSPRRRIEVQLWSLRTGTDRNPHA